MKDGHFEFVALTFNDFGSLSYTHIAFKKDHCCNNQH